jgi:hypothetical protein
MRSWLWWLAVLAAAPVYAHGPGRLSQVEVVDRASGRAIPVHVSDGRHYVVGKPGKEYAIRIRNRVHEDLLAVVSVDGVNAVTGETASTDQGGYILGPARTFEVRGWRKSLERVAAFYFSRLDESYAARTGRPEHVGVIGVALFKRKPEVPLYEPESRSRNEAPAPSAAEKRKDSAQSALGTGQGRSETSIVRYAQFERASEIPDETIVIYYDSYDNLVARGVLPSQRREPQPFPAGFVPDPPSS